MTLEFTREAVKAIAEKALTKKTGARGLRSILELLLLDAMFEAPGSSIKIVRIDEKVVAGGKRPEYVFRQVKEQKDEQRHGHGSGGKSSQK